MPVPATQSLAVFCVLLMCLANSVAQGTSPAALEPLPVEIASLAKSFAAIDIDLSPDGSSVAYTLGDPRRRKLQGLPSDQWKVFTCTGAPYLLANTDLLITNTKTGQTINISSGHGANWGPRWSPDGKSLAFYSDRSGKTHVWLWEQSTAKLRALSTAVVHVRFNFERIIWTPDSRRVITKVLGAGQRNNGCFEPGASRPPPDQASK